MTTYIKVNGSTQVNYLRVDFNYSKGGYNYFTYKQESRGYYIHVSPVNKVDRMETYTAFSGIKACLLEVTRKSNKAEAQALEKFEAEKQKYIDYVLTRHGLTVEV